MDALPAAQGSTTTLLHILLKIIERSVTACNLEVPEPLALATSNLLVGRFIVQHISHQDLVWPYFPAVSSLLLGSATDPLKLKAPVVS